MSMVFVFKRLVVSSVDACGFREILVDKAFGDPIVRS